MELRYLVLLIIKILISIPSTVIFIPGTHGASLMGGHLNNTINSTKTLNSDKNEATTNVAANATYLKYEDDNTNQYDEYEDENEDKPPNASPLVLPGYNLPETIFNKGKPFYLEKDPLTGEVNFDSKVSGEEFEYYDQDNSNIYAKENIDRKDGHYGSHKASDINQLTPNFHDFLNLPVKYNPDKYVYPLISSSYANTKIQGNIEKYHNHKDGVATTYKPNVNPSYQTKAPYFKSSYKSTPPSTTTTTTTEQNFVTTPPASNLMNSAMNYPQFNDVSEKATTKKHQESTTVSTHRTTKTTTAPSTTTKRTLSFFEQLFGDYEETTTQKGQKPPPLFANIPSNKNKNVSVVTATQPDKFDNVLTGSAMGNSYEYEDYDADTTENIMSSSTAESSKSTPPSSTTQKISTTTKAYTTPTTVSTTPIAIRTTAMKTTTKVTSLPLGENHIVKPDIRPSVIAISSNNLKERLENEKLVPRPFEVPPFKPNNVHMAPDQDTVSFVVGHQQNVAGDFSDSMPLSNSFRPLLVESDDLQDSVSYTVQAKPEFVHSVFPSEPAKPVAIGGSSVSLQPMQNSEAALSIGVPLNGNKQKPGQVMDEDLEDSIEFPKGPGSKIVFPDEQEQKTTVPSPDNREILQLNSQPMYHQLPSDLTPPRETEVPPPRVERPRPPWDPRPGHFHNGRPEYSRPPRPGSNFPIKRIDNLPNILPQFRPNAKGSNAPHLMEAKLHPRQPLLDRPSNKPMEYYEKLIPPPPPKNLQHLRKVPALEQELKLRQKQNEDSKKVLPHEHFAYFPTPPNVVLPERRQAFEPEVETLQMIQAKKSEKKESATASFKTNLKGRDTTEKPLYVVYPVNSASINMDTVDSDKKETVVVGTRAELPLPPSKINQEFNYAIPKDRNDGPVLKPHHKPSFPIMSDFPYPLERPDVLPNFDAHNSNQLEETRVTSNNQWNSVDETEARIVNLNPQATNQISVTLKTFTDKPIAIAYTPTEPQRRVENTEKYSMPNYAGPVISEILPGQKGDSEITVSAVMHTHPQHTLSKVPLDIQHAVVHNHRIEENITHHPPVQQDFQAPFQASVNLDKMSQGWTVVKNTPSIDRADHEDSLSASTVASTSEFDIENFKPQLFGGFQPIYPKAETTNGKTEITDRQE